VVGAVAAGDAVSTATPRERGIIFSGPMVRAILENRKTQTRRVMRAQWPADTVPKEHSQCPGDWLPYTPDGRLRNNLAGDRAGNCGVRCPYGVRGDRLWVREGFCYRRDPISCKLGGYYYAATDPGVEKTDDDGHTVYLKNGTAASPWVSPLHMPREVSRLTLEVTDVRVERVQDITEEDARAEGVASAEEYAAPWSSNPWVWSVSFRRLL
jgi:hypothetical protein